MLSYSNTNLSKEYMFFPRLAVIDELGWECYRCKLRSSTYVFSITSISN